MPPGLSPFLLAGVGLHLLLKMQMSSAALNYFCWLLMAVNWFHGAGYLLINFFFGDWPFVVRTVDDPLVWQIALFVLGLAIYFAAELLWAKTTIEPLLGETATERLARARTMMWIPYLAGSFTLVFAPLLNPSSDVLPVALAEGCGSTSLLLFLPSVVEKPQHTAPPSSISIVREFRIMAAGLVI